MEFQRALIFWLLDERISKVKEADRLPYRRQRNPKLSSGFPYRSLQLPNGISKVSTTFQSPIWTEFQRSTAFQPPPGQNFKDIYLRNTNFFHFFLVLFNETFTNVSFYFFKTFTNVSLFSKHYQRFSFFFFFRGLTLQTEFRRSRTLKYSSGLIFEGSTTLDGFFFHFVNCLLESNQLEQCSKPLTTCKCAQLFLSDLFY
ncbi:unnamed protein product [Rhizophagus irregularis]|nr:unnamed protein product [Rhizophagus irregularis]